MWILFVWQVVEEYNRREQEIKHLEKELEDKTNALNAYRQNISEVDSLSLQWNSGIVVYRNVAQSVIYYNLTWSTGVQTWV